MKPPDDFVRIAHLREAAEKALGSASRRAMPTPSVFAIDLHVLWATITEDLPLLLASLPTGDAFTA